MSLQYRMIAQDSRPHAREASANAFSLWLQDRKQLDADLSEVGRRPLRDHIELSVETAEDAALAIQRYALYEEQQGGRWTTSLTSIQNEGDHWVWLDVEWVSEDPWGRAPIVKPPRLAEYLLVEESIHEGRVVLPPMYYVVADEAAASELASLILEDPRGRPIVVLSHDPAASAAELRARAIRFSRELIGVAPVYLMSDVAGEQLNKQLPPELAVYAGAARTYLPSRGNPAQAMARHRVLGAGHLRLDAGRAAAIVAGPLRARALTERPPEIYRQTGRAVLRNEGAAGADEALLQELLAAEESAERANSEAVRLENALETAVLETLEAQDERDASLARLRYLEGELASANVYTAGLPTPEQYIESVPSSFEEVLENAKSTLGALIVGADNGPALLLDAYTESPSWARKAWRALVALNSFAEARASGWAGDFKMWCSEPPAGAAPGIPANWVALLESSTVGNNPKHHSARIFAVPTAVDSSGKAYMESHVKIVEGGRPAPRIHFFDSTAVDGRVHVGYIGPHLPNSKTN